MLALIRKYRQARTHRHVVEHRIIQRRIPRLHEDLLAELPGIEALVDAREYLQACRELNSLIAEQVSTDDGNSDVPPWAVLIELWACLDDLAEFHFELRSLA